MTKAGRPCKRLVKIAGGRCPKHAEEEDPAIAETKASEATGASEKSSGAIANLSQAELEELSE